MKSWDQFVYHNKKGNVCTHFGIFIYAIKEAHHEDCRDGQEHSQAQACIG